LFKISEKREQQYGQASNIVQGILKCKASHISDSALNNKLAFLGQFLFENCKLSLHKTSHLGLMLYQYLKIVLLSSYSESCSDKLNQRKRIISTIRVSVVNS